MSTTDSVTDPAYVEVPCTSCIEQVDAFTWAEALVPVSAGGFVLGLRVNSPELGELVRELFAERLVPGARPDRNYSLWLSSSSADGVTDLHRLYRSFVRTIRTRSPRRVLDTLWHELDLRDVRATGRHPLFDVTVFVRDGEAHLLPGLLRRTIVDDLRRWESAGFRLVERCWATIDLGAGEVVLPAPRWPVPEQELVARLATLELDDRDEGPSAVGRFPIATWTTDGGEQTGAARVGQAGMQVLDREQRLGLELLTGLSTLLPQLSDLGPSWVGLDALRSTLHAQPRV